MSQPVLGKSISGASVHLDVDRLISTRMLITANSGAGKSWAIRRILELTHGSAQQIVIDPEGEFFTLREKYDYVLAGKGGDCPAEPRSAALLARKLLELGTSAILDLYELAPRDRVLFVRRFLEALIDAPRELWHPALIVIDEAHAFAPEKSHGDAESVDAVARLMAQGRKRGFAGLLATQRLSKLAKDVAAEANNLLIGRTALDVDLKRAGTTLGMSARDAAAKLPHLKAGHFFAFGPALAATVVEFQVGDVTTSHPKAGERAAPPPPPRERVRKILGQLADLPKEAEEETRSISEARAKIKELERELASAKKAQPAAKVERVEVPVIGDRAASSMETLARALTDLFAKHQRDMEALIERITPVLEEQVGTIARATQQRATADTRIPPRPAPRELVPVSRNGHAPARRVAPMSTAPDTTIGAGERACLIAIAQTEGGCTREQVSILAGYKRSTRDAYLQRLSARGLIDVAREPIVATDAGLDALGNDFEPLPTGDALREYWLAKLPEGERKVLEVVCAAYPDSIDREEVSDRTGYKRSTRDAYAQRLRTRKLVYDIGRGLLSAATELFEEQANYGTRPTHVSRGTVHADG